MKSTLENIWDNIYTSLLTTSFIFTIVITNLIHWRIVQMTYETRLSYIMYISHILEAIISYVNVILGIHQHSPHSQDSIHVFPNFLQHPRPCLVCTLNANVRTLQTTHKPALSTALTYYYVDWRLDYCMSFIFLIDYLPEGKISIGGKTLYWF